MTDFPQAWLSQRIVADSRDAIIVADREGIIRCGTRARLRCSVIPRMMPWAGPWT